MITLKQVPQVKGHFLIGSLVKFTQDPLQALCDWQQQYGDIVSFNIAKQKFYLFSHPEFVEQGAIKQSKNFVKLYDPKKPSGLALLLGQGLLTSKGELWRRQRRLTQPVFQRSNLALMLPQMQLAGSNMLQRWQQLPPGKELNLNAEMTELTMEVITQTMFSTSVKDKVKQISGALDTGLRYAAKTMANPLMLPLYIPTPANQKFKKAKNLLMQVIEEMIEQRRSQPGLNKDLLEMLINAQDSENGSKMDNRQIADEVITIFTAGHETTATLLTWTLYYLSKNPEILSKLRTELQQQVGDKIPNTDDIQQLTYARAVINESMRIRPPAGFIVRQVEEDCIVNDYSISAGSLAIFNIYGIHHHQAFWQDPEQFQPDRFLVDQKRRFSYMPFGTGERICIGNHFAMLESQLLLSMIIQHFDIELIDSTEVKMEMAVTIRPKGGIPIRIKPRR